MNRTRPTPIETLQMRLGKARAARDVVECERLHRHLAEYYRRNAVDADTDAERVPSWRLNTRHLNLAAHYAAVVHDLGSA